MTGDLDKIFTELKYQVQSDLDNGCEIVFTLDAWLYVIRKVDGGYQLVIK